MNRRFVVLVTVLALAVAACGGNGATDETTSTTAQVKKLRVVTTTPQLADFAKIIGGENIEHYSLIKSGVDPHDYEPTAGDISALSKADYIIKNGVGLEEWFDKTMEGVEKKGVVVDASEGVTLRYRDQKRSTPDPHIWHSPLNAKIMVANIVRALAAGDPSNAEVFRGNERAYDAQLDGLDQRNRQLLNSLSNKKLVTNHDSLGYYIDEYRLTLVGTVIPTFDSQAELSSSEISALVAKIKAENVKAIFTESSLPPRTAETIAKEAGVKIVEGENSLFGDSLGSDEESNGGSYLKAETHNTNVIVNNLR